MSRALVAGRPPAPRSSERANLRSRNASIRADPSSTEAGTYWARSESPLTSLAFLCPLLAVYEIGTRYYGQGSIIAFSLLHRFFALLGVNDSVFPPLIVIITLLVAHFAQRERQRVVITDILAMAVESTILAIPLLVLWFAATPYLNRLATFSNPATSATIPCLGAGIYEEFMFRLIALNLLGFVLFDVFQLNRNLSFVLMVFTSATLFSAYHYLGSEHFSSVTFIFRFVAGVYFATIFLCRGYAITSGSHAAYDIIVVALQFAR